MSASCVTTRKRAWRVLPVVALLGGMLLVGAPAGAAAPRWPACNPNVGLIGYSDALDKQTYAATDIGGLSGMVYDAARDVYYSLVDGQGTTAARIYTLRIPQTQSGLGAPVVTAVTTLLNANGAPFTGANFDGEGLTLATNGDWLIASETEPSLRRFARDGRLLAELPVPQRFKVAPAGQAVHNAAFEGVSLSPSGKSLFVVMEAPLGPDGYTLTGKGRNRILRYVPDNSGLNFHLAAEYYYQTQALQAVSDVLALSDDRLLVLERSYVPGYGNTVRVFSATLTNAADVSAIAALGSSKATPVPKTLLVDIAGCPDAGVPNRQPQPNRLLDNYEALAWGRSINGERTLLLVSDDNFNPAQTTRVLALSVPTRALVGRGW